MGYGSTDGETRMGSTVTAAVSASPLDVFAYASAGSTLAKSTA